MPCLVMQDVEKLGMVMTESYLGVSQMMICLMLVKLNFRQISHLALLFYFRQ